MQTIEHLPMAVAGYSTLQDDTLGRMRRKLLPAEPTMQPRLKLGA